MNIWDVLYEKALEVQNGRVISPFVDGTIFMTLKTFISSEATHTQQAEVSTC